VGGTTQKDTQDGVSHLRECGVASTSLHCVVMSVCTSLYEISLDEQTKYNPFYPGIHSFVDHTYHAASERHYTVRLFSAALQQSATQEILQRTAHVGGASLLTKNDTSYHCELKFA